MLQEEVAYITGVSYWCCVIRAVISPKHTLNWERETPLQNKTRCKDKDLYFCEGKAFQSLGIKRKLPIDTKDWTEERNANPLRCLRKWAVALVSPPLQSVEYRVVYSPNSPVFVQYCTAQCQRAVTGGNHKQRIGMSQAWNFPQLWDPLDFNSFLTFQRAGGLRHVELAGVRLVQIE